MTKHINKITAVLMLLFISFVLVFTIIKEKGKESFHENRELAQRPSFSPEDLYDGSFTRQLNTFITDHFAGRSHWISAKSRLGAQFSEKIINGVYIADGRLLDAEISKRSSFEKSVSEINRYVEGCNGAIYFVAVPTSSGIYDEYLPEYLLSNPENMQISSLYASLDSNIRKIDAYNILKMLKENYIFYRNDTKWTSYGAYCVYRTVIQKLGFLPTAYDKYTIDHVISDFRGNLYNRTLYDDINPDIIDIYTYPSGAEVISSTSYDNEGHIRQKLLYDKSMLNSNYKYRVYLGSEVPMIKIKTSVNNERKLLVIKDSYADCFIPFLTQHYSEIAVFSPEYSEKGLADFLNPNDYEQTLFLFGIESMSNENCFKVLNK